MVEMSTRLAKLRRSGRERRQNEYVWMITRYHWLVWFGPSNSYPRLSSAVLSSVLSIRACTVLIFWRVRVGGQHVEFC